MNACRVWLTICLLLAPLVAAAQDEQHIPPLPDGAPIAIFDRQHDSTDTGADGCTAGCCAIPGCTAGAPCGGWFAAGWFVGLGGSYNSVKIDQTFSGIGDTDIYESGVLVATGTAGGPAPPFRQTGTTFAPLAQFGFIRPLRESGWSWGTKFSYKFLGLTLTDQNVDAPQNGSFTTTDVPPVTTDFTGNAFSLSLQTSVNNELALVTFVNREFSHGRVYLGGGPVVFDVQNRMYGLYSYADINGVSTDIGGPPLDLAGESWLWGGIGQLGLMYYLRPRCFLDISYDFAVTGNYNESWPVNVTTQSGSDTYVTAIQYLVEQQIWAQSLNVTLNWTF